MSRTYERTWNNVALNGLLDALTNLQKMKETTEREVVQSKLMAGGHGKGVVMCNCKVAYNTNQCLYKKVGRICQSVCHQNNIKCVNHDRRD
jgi:hypothetical protein